MADRRATSSAGNGILASRRIRLLLRSHAGSAQCLNAPCSASSARRRGRLGQGGVYPGRSVLIAGRTGTLQSSSFTHGPVPLSRPSPAAQMLVSATARGAWPGRRRTTAWPRPAQRRWRSTPPT